MNHKIFRGLYVCRETTEIGICYLWKTFKIYFTHTHIQNSSFLDRKINVGIIFLNVFQVKCQTFTGTIQKMGTMLEIFYINLSIYINLLHKFISVQSMESATVWKPDISWIVITRFWLHSWNRTQKMLLSISKIRTFGFALSSTTFDHSFAVYAMRTALLKRDLHVFSAFGKLIAKWRQESLTFGRNTTCNFPLTPM